MKMKAEQGVPPLRATSGARVNADVMSDKMKQRWTHRHIDKFMRFMGILYACHVSWLIAIHFLIRSQAPDHEFNGMLYVLIFLVYAGLYFAWRKHLLFVACGLGAVLCILVAYLSLTAGLSANEWFWKLVSFAAVPIALGLFGWMFVWYPIKLIKRVT